MPQAGYVQAGQIEKAPSISTVLSQALDTLRGALTELENIHQRMVPTPQATSGQSTPPNSGVIGTASDIRAIAQRIQEEVMRLSEKV